MTRYTHGDQVVVNGEQGAVVSVYAQWRGVGEAMYDVQPNDAGSMRYRICGVPESKLVAAATPASQ